MNLESLKSLLVDELSDIHDAEKQLTKTLPKMIEAVTEPALKRCFENHLDETTSQVERLDRIFMLLQERPESKTCKAMEGLIKEGTERVKAKGEPSVIDAGLIAAAQRIEHYEIAAYGCSRTYAELLGEHEVAAMLQDSLEEEKAADEKLSFLAEGTINLQAARA